MLSDKRIAAIRKRVTTDQYPIDAEAKRAAFDELLAERAALVAVVEAARRYQRAWQAVEDWHNKDEMDWSQQYFDIVHEQEEALDGLFAALDGDA